MKITVTPYVGVWIETSTSCKRLTLTQVTPYVGVWIETSDGLCKRSRRTSHPTWVCGLKLRMPAHVPLRTRHTLRGCVD